MDRCVACAYVYGDVPVADVAPRLAALAPRFRAVAGVAAGDALRRRRDEQTWSALEYLCHVRDVLQVQRERLLLALETDEPKFVSMNRDARAVSDRYNEQDLVRVLDDLDAAAHALAGTFAGLTPEQWLRTGIYNWPERASRTMAWLGRHTVHEGVHHLRDVEQVLQTR